MFYLLLNSVFKLLFVVLFCKLILFWTVHYDRLGHMFIEVVLKCFFSWPPLWRKQKQIMLQRLKSLKPPSFEWYKLVQGRSLLVKQIKIGILSLFHCAKLFYMSSQLYCQLPLCQRHTENETDSPPSSVVQGNNTLQGLYSKIMNGLLCGKKYLNINKLCDW